MTHRNAFALAGRKSFEAINSGRHGRSAPSYVLLGFQPEEYSLSIKMCKIMLRFAELN